MSFQPNADILCFWNFFAKFHFQVKIFIKFLSAQILYTIYNSQERPWYYRGVSETKNLSESSNDCSSKINLPDTGCMETSYSMSLYISKTSSQSKS